MIRKIFYGCALFFLGAAFAAVLADCAKSVAFTGLRFTSVADFLTVFGAGAAITACKADSLHYFLCKILYYIPAWPVFLLPACLFYRLSNIRLHLRAYARYKMRHIFVSLKPGRPLQHKNW